MAIEEQSRFPGRAEPLRADQRIAGPFDETRVLETGTMQPIPHKLGGATDIGRVLGKRANAWNLKEADEIVQVQS